MSLSPDEAHQVLRQIRARMSDSPLSWYAGVASEEVARENDPRRQLLLFLDSVAEYASASASGAVSSVVQRLSTHVSSSEGAAIDGILVTNAEGRARVNDAEVFELIEDPRLARLAADLATLRDDLRRDWGIETRGSP